MGVFAWRNLMTRPLRTALALIGLSVPILGVLGLFCLSGALRNLVGDTLNQIQGIMVLRSNVPSPVFSDVEANLAEKIRAVPGVRIVATEVWKLAPAVEGKNLIMKSLGEFTKGQSPVSLFDAPVIQGQDIPSHSDLRTSVYGKATRERGTGRFLNETDRGQPHIVISKKLAKQYGSAEGVPKQVGDTLRIDGKPFKIVGIYDTGSMFLDVVIVMDIDVARKLVGVASDRASSFYVEMTDPSKNQEIAALIEQAVSNVDARSMEEFQANFGILMSQLDLFLLMTVSLALLVGVVGIINTMLMSTTERFVEFGVLRTNGWSRGHVLALVTCESAMLGLLSGVIGCAIALLAAFIANRFLTGGLVLAMPLWLLGLGIALSVVTGTLGGLYPAWKASRLVPMDAIRLGSH